MEPTEDNIRAFEAAHKARAEPVELPPVVQRTLGDMTKKRVLHLHCGTGEATATLAELGAVVVKPATGPRWDRDDIRLLAIDARSGEHRDGRMAQLPELLRRGDVVVVNDAATLPQRDGARQGHDQRHQDHDVAIRELQAQARQ